jgi:hypothetical protein
MKYFFTIIVFALLLTNADLSYLMAQEAKLKVADSLFQAQKYTDALANYEAIFEEGSASPAMLTKMAFIQEGLGNYPEALYYLNLHYKHTLEKKTLQKMRDLAEEHNLYGYEYNDIAFLANQVSNYRFEIIISLAAFSIFLLFYGYRKRKHSEKPAISLVLQVFTLVSIGILCNDLLSEEAAIVDKDNSMIMSGPSGAAEPIDFLAKGHKVEVIDQEPLWTEIKWGDDQVFIRTKNLKPL